MESEFFDDKLRSIGHAIGAIVNANNLTLDDRVFLEAITHIGKQINRIQRFLV